MVNLTKKRLVNKLDSYGLGHTKQELTHLVSDLLSIMKEQLHEGSDLRLSKFGTFEVVDKTARIGRNPKTKEDVIISRRKVVRFGASPKLLERINKD